MAPAYCIWLSQLHVSESRDNTTDMFWSRKHARCHSNEHLLRRLRDEWGEQVSEWVYAIPTDVIVDSDFGQDL